MSDCPQCRVLHQQVIELLGLVEQLRRQNSYLQQLLGALTSGVTATRALVARERDKPSIPLRRLVTVVEQRLTELVDMTRRKR